MNAATRLRHWAAQSPATPALRVPDPNGSGWLSASFGQLDRASDALAHGFAGLGVSPGDRAVVLVKPSIDLYATLFALFKVGAVPCLVDPGMGPKAVLAAIERIRPRALVAEPAVHAIACVKRSAFASVELRAAPRWFPGVATFASLAKPDAGPYPLADRAPDDDAAILFTSGSTGPAKGVASRQAMFDAQVEALGAMFQFRPGAADLQCFAAFALFDISLGMTSILPRMDLTRPATADPRELVACAEAFAPEVMFASPIVWQRLAPWCVERGIHLTSIETALTVGAPIPASLHRTLQRVLRAGAQVYTPYGATEAMPIASIGSDELLAGPAEASEAGAGTCVGRVLPGVGVHIIAVTDEPIARWEDAIALAPGEIGEVVVEGAVVSRAYKDSPEGNALAKIRRGEAWLHRMGDLGRVDDQGRLWFCGRKAHRLQTADGMLAPVPLENVANATPGVFRTAVVGVGTVGRQTAVLCVEMRVDSSWGPGVEAQMRARLDASPFAGRVARFLVHPGFPTDARHNSKIRSEELARWAAARCQDLS